MFRFTVFIYVYAKQELIVRPSPEGCPSQCRAAIRRPHYQIGWAGKEEQGLSFEAIIKLTKNRSYLILAYLLLFFSDSLISSTLIEIRIIINKYFSRCANLINNGGWLED